jgi:hypothetical protein
LAGEPLLQIIYRKPFPGLIAFGVALLSQWLGHSAYTFIHTVAGNYHYALSLLVGAVGAWLVWRSLKQPELGGTWMGFLGATLIWVGWFEFTFEFFAELYQIPPYIASPGVVSNGGSNLLQATMPIAAALFVVYGLFNRQTKCNLMRWVHRNLHMSPGMPTSDNGRSIGRVTAMETLFVIWACYLFWLYVGYFGVTTTVNLIAYGIWAAWCAYIFLKLLKIPRVGHALRYGIPVGVVAWGLVEMPAHFGMYPEIWLKPFKFPVTTLIVLGCFIAGMVYVAVPAPTIRRLEVAAAAAAR